MASRLCVIGCKPPDSAGGDRPRKACKDRTGCDRGPQGRNRRDEKGKSHNGRGNGDACLTDRNPVN